MFARVLLASMCALLGGCNFLLSNNPGTPAVSEDDAGAGTDDTALTDAGSHRKAEAGTGIIGDPPSDIACTVTWTEVELVESNCTSRKVVTLRGGIHAPLALAVEKTPSGRLGIAVHTEVAAEKSVLTFDQFVPSSDGLMSPKLSSYVFDDGTFVRTGVAAALAQAGSDRLYLLYQSLAGAGEIRFVEVGDNGPVAASETVASGITAPTYLSLAVAASGDALATYFEPKNSALAAKIRPAKTGSFGGRTEVHGMFATGGVPGSGQSSAAFDDTNSPLVAYHRADVPLSTQPWFNQWSGSGWFSKKQIETPTFGLNSMKGYSIAFGVFQSTRHVAYFASGTSDRQIQLRYASWQSFNEEPVAVVLSDGIEVEDPLLPRANVSMAIDRYGLVHLAAVIPRGPQTSVKYIRQALSSGKVKWITDEIDRSYSLSGVDSALVDLAIDENSRPHIVYHWSLDDSLHYASYFDR